MEQHPVKLTYVLTPADLREGLPAGTGRQRPAWRKILGLVGWLLFLASLLFGWLVSSLTRNIAPNVQPIPPRPEIDDLWLVLLPTLIPVTLIAYGYATVLLKNALIKEGLEPAAVSRRNSILARVSSVVVTVITIGGIWLLVHPESAWIWTPSRPKILVFAVGPWIILFVLLGLLAPLKRRVSVRTLWNTTAPVRRPKSLEIDQNGIMIMDSRFSSRYRWNHFVRYSETSNLLRLHMEDHRILLIPKRAIDPNDIVPLRVLISENILEGKFILSDPRFQVVVPRPVLAAPDQADTAPPGTTI
jgi:hypothetical protein